MPSFIPQLVLSAVTIIFVNLVLSGDNAVVIALAVRSLPHGRRVQHVWLKRQYRVFSLHVARLYCAGLVMALSVVPL